MEGIGTLEVHIAGTMFVMDENGDSRMQWNSKNTDEVEAARSRFEHLKKKGYLAYKVNKQGDRGEVLDEFDPNAERIIMAGRMVGG